MTYPLEIEGNHFNSLKAAATHYKQDYEETLKRIASGFSAEGALGVSKEPSKPKVQPSDVYYLYVTSHTKVSYSTATRTHSDFKSDNLDKEDALLDKDYESLYREEANTSVESPAKTNDVSNINQANTIQFEHEGKPYFFVNKAQACKHFNVAESTYRGRIKKGMDIPSALGLTAPSVEPHKLAALVEDKPGKDDEHKGAIKPTPMTLEDNGVTQTFDSQTDACKHYGVTTSTFRSRVARGWSTEEALGIKPRQAQKSAPSHSNSITLKTKDGEKVFSSLNELSAYYKTAPSTIRGRLKRGMTIEEAVGSLQ